MRDVEVLLDSFNTCSSVLFFKLSYVPDSMLFLPRQVIPDALTQVIRKFTHDLDSWLRTAMHDLPDNLRQVKLDRK